MIAAMPASSEFVDWEVGSMSRSREVDFFQRLADTGELDTLSARYQNRARELIEQGEVFL